MPILTQSQTDQQNKLKKLPPRTLAWRDGEGACELVVRVNASDGPSLGSRSYVWRVFEGTRLLNSDIGITLGLSEAAAEAIALMAASQWIKQHHPDVVIRVRSALERLARFGSRYPRTRRQRRRAA
jgi:hypothetical protein